MKRNNTIKKLAPTILIACALLLSGCANKTGKIATNIDSSTGEVISQDSLDTVNKDLIDNIKNLVKDAPSVDSLSFSDSITKYDFATELEKRKANFVLCAKEDKVQSTDVVNVSFVEITLSSGEAVYDLNVGYDFDLNSDVDSSFKNGLVNHTVGEKITIDQCKMPDGTTAKVKVKINYITRKADNLDSLNALLPEGATSYETWLQASLDKAASVNDIWTQVLGKASIDETMSGYTEYFDNKYNNALEYYSMYNENVDKEALKTIIKDQVEKELLAFYYAAEYDIKLGEYKDEDIKNIALYYGYTVDGFKAKYSNDVIENTILMDMVGAKIFNELSK